MVSKKYSLENETIMSLTALINNFRSDLNSNQGNNDKLAFLIDYLCECLEKGIEPEKKIISYIVHKAMETTKSDEYAGDEVKDLVMIAGNKIFDVLMFPKRKKGLLLVRIRIFQKEYNKSLRRHYNQRDNVFLKGFDTLIKHVSFQTITAVETESEKKKEKKNFFGKLTKKEGD